MRQRERLSQCYPKRTNSRARALRGKAEGKTEGEARGKAEGKAEGKAQAVLAVLEARGLAPTEQQRQRILACTDLEQLNSWVRKAVTLVDVEELFAR